MTKPRDVCHCDAKFVFVVEIGFCILEHLVGADFAAGVVSLDDEVWQREIIDAKRPIIDLTTVVCAVLDLLLRIVIFIMRKRMNRRELAAKVENVFEVTADFKIVGQSLVGDVECAAVSRA